jgi:hypothetical protein
MGDNRCLNRLSLPLAARCREEAQEKKIQRQNISQERGEARERRIHSRENSVTKEKVGQQQRRSTRERRTCQRVEYLKEKVN